MGKVIMERLLELDAQVVAAGLAMDKLPEKPNLQKLTIDISKWEDAYNELLKVGPVDGLVNNAGVAFIEPFLETTNHGWDQ